MADTRNRSLIDHKQAQALCAALDGEDPRSAVSDVIDKMQQFREALLKDANQAYIQQLHGIGPRLKEVQMHMQEVNDADLEADEKEKMLLNYMQDDMPKELAQQLGITLEFVDTIGTLLCRFNEAINSLEDALKVYLKEKAAVECPESEQRAEMARERFQQEKHKLIALITLFRTRFGSKVSEPCRMALEEGLNLDDAAGQVASGLGSMQATNSRLESQ